MNDWRGLFYAVLGLVALGGLTVAWAVFLAYPPARGAAAMGLGAASLWGLVKAFSWRRGDRFAPLALQARVDVARRRLEAAQRDLDLYAGESRANYSIDPGSRP